MSHKHTEAWEFRELSEALTEPQKIEDPAEEA